MDSGSTQFTTFILRVDTQTPGWENTMIKVLKGIPGASFSIDPNGMARVSGNIDPGKTLKLLAKAGKHAQVYSIDSGLRNKSSSSEMRRDHDHGYDHFLDDHQHGRRYWQSNIQYYHHPYDSFPSSTPPYLRQTPMLPPPPPQQYYYDSEPSQCMIM